MTSSDEVTPARPQRLAILGVGVMGETILSGLIDAGWDRSTIVGTDRRAARRSELSSRYGIVCLENTEAVRGADTVVLVVKPQDLPELLLEIRPVLAPDALVITVAAGVTTDLVESKLPEGAPVVRVMPNTPAMVGEGMAAISGGVHASAEHVGRAVDLMRAVGKAIVVPEKYQDAVTAISGSGPAYLFFVVEAMIEAGVHLGLPRDVSTELVVQTMLGSATLLRDSGTHPTVLREQVTSPGGTTAAAIRELEDHKVRAAFMTAMEAARNRSQALAENLRDQH
ncbi:pyrroline-5-carboxylate reductase [Aestuariimicrobium kwangyangense]|uniref:pyrroline-5-carboxylate reductase n=1 Tax=Aestuariimicrobium kwangyangense TaxID=396389 RepID=UPI0003B6060E|nr:pyrroline-5-carboxylate reductase [Aestuariimicrobium kwangyangense]